MDKIDRYIKEIVDREIQEPEHYKNVVQNALKSPRARIRIYKYKIIRVLSVACTSVVIIGGTVFAGVIAYEKIWKEPKEYTYQELQETLANVEVPVDKREGLITEDEAKAKANEILDNLGYGKHEIVQIELKNDINQENGEYYMKTDTNEKKGYDINISARTGELNSFTDKELVYKNIKVDNIEDDIAKEYANENEILVDSNFDENNYKFACCEEIDYIYEKEPIEMWNARYYKEYNNIYNPYESVNINFLVSDGNLEIESITKESNGKYAGNPVEVSKEDAVEVAKNKEMEFTSNEISSVTVELGIRKMNTYIYKFEKNTTIINNNEDNIEINMLKNSEARQVWIVSIYHKNIKKEENALEQIKGVNKKYYIDATTKEIIGGDEIYEKDN